MSWGIGGVYRGQFRATGVSRGVVWGAGSVSALEVPGAYTNPQTALPALSRCR